MGPIVALALPFVLFTAQRPGEVRDAQWSDFDLNTGWWTLPAERTKNALSHRVPLTPQAIAILEEARELSASEVYVFAVKSDRPLTKAAMSRAVARNRAHFEIDHFTPHDLRRTAATRMTSLGVMPAVVSKILNHKEQGVTAVYDRHSYDAEKREALGRYSTWVDSLLWS